MTGKCTFDECFGKIAVIDMVLENLPNEDRKIIMTVCLED